MSLGFLDILLVIASVVFVVALGLRVSARHVASRNLDFGARETPAWAIGVSAFAGYSSSLSLLGYVGWSYRDGLSSFILQLNFPLVAMIVALYFVPKFYALGLPSVYEFHRLRFGKRAEIVSSAGFLISQFLACSGVVYSTSLILSELLSLPLWLCTGTIGLLTLIYCRRGEIETIVWTDVAQTALVFTLVCVIGVFVYLDYAALPAQGPLIARPTDLSLSLDLSDKYSPWSALLALTIYRIQATGTSQFMIQRALGAKSLADARTSVRWMGMLSVPVPLVLLSGGLAIRHIFAAQPFEDYDLVVLRYLGELTVPGIKGLFIAAVMAACMSTLDSTLNSLSTVSRRLRASGESASQKKSKDTLVWALGILVAALAFSLSGGLVLELVVSLGGLFAGQELAMFLIGFNSKKINESSILCGALLGVVATSAAFFTESISWPWYCLIGALGTVVGCLGCHLLAPGTRPANTFAAPTTNARLTKSDALLLAAFAISLALFIFVAM